MTVTPIIPHPLAIGSRRGEANNRVTQALQCFSLLALVRASAWRQPVAGDEFVNSHLAHHMLVQHAARPLLKQNLFANKVAHRALD